MPKGFRIDVATLFNILTVVKFLIDPNTFFKATCFQPSPNPIKIQTLYLVIIYLYPKISNILYLSLWWGVCVCVVCGMYVCTHTWRPEIDSGVFFNSFPTYIFVAGFLIELGIHWFPLDRLVSKYLGPSCLCLLRADFLQAYITASSFYMESGARTQFFSQIEPSHWVPVYILEKWK